MIQHIWSVLCQNSLIDKTSNTISLIEVVEDLGLPGPPLPAGEQGLIPIHCSLVSNWERVPSNQPTRGTVRVRTIRPTGECEREQEYSVDLSATPRSRTIAKISGITFREAGRHVFEIHVKEDGETEWRKVAGIPFNITIQSAPDSN